MFQSLLAHCKVKIKNLVSSIREKDLFSYGLKISVNFMSLTQDHKETRHLLFGFKLQKVWNHKYNLTFCTSGGVEECSHLATLIRSINTLGFISQLTLLHFTSLIIFPWRSDYCKDLSEWDECSFPWSSRIAILYMTILHKGLYFLCYQCILSSKPSPTVNRKL